MGYCKDLSKSLIIDRNELDQYIGLFFVFGRKADSEIALHYIGRNITCSPVCSICILNSDDPFKQPAEFKLPTLKVEAKQSSEKPQSEPTSDAEVKSNDEKESRQEKITSAADASVKKLQQPPNLLLRD